VTSGGEARAALAEAVRASGLAAPGSGGVALCSGGADSAGLLAGLAGHCGAERVVALHLDYGLRDDSSLDAEACAALCTGLGVELVVERPDAPSGGNLQAWAREARYDAAERVRLERGLDWVATGHTRTDLAETVIYRLASSPGRRALLGLPRRRGAIVRPLLGVGREQVRRLVAEADLPFRDDASNEQPVFARNRIRNEVLPVLRELAPAPEATIAETMEEIREDAEALEAYAAEALERTGAGAAGAISVEALAALDPATRRLLLRVLAERAAGRPVAFGRSRAAELMRLAREDEGGVLELGGGLEARAEHGHVRFALGSDSPPDEAPLTIPGSCRFGHWRLRADVREGPVRPDGPETAYLDPDSLGERLLVRSWRPGDRIRPLGLDGSKSLQDLFTDRKVPRSLRRALPVVTAGDGAIAWIAGVAVSAEFAAPKGDRVRAAVITAAAAPADPGGARA
jgi:tRNA(Ile)-lysidine synthase